VKKIWFKGQDLTRPEELELLAPFGLSTNYLSKGPLKADKSERWTLRGEPVIIPDISRSDRLQYPEAAVQEGVAATVSTPILFLQEGIGQVGKGLRYFSISKNCHTVKISQHFQSLRDVINISGLLNFYDLKIPQVFKLDDMFGFCQDTSSCRVKPKSLVYYDSS